MTFSFGRWLNNRNLIFLFALILGFLWDAGAQYTQRLILPGLAIVMTLSSMGISSDAFRSLRSLLSSTFIGILGNFVLHNAVLIGLSALIIEDQFFWKGFILLAAVPPAVAVIPFSLFLRGNSELALLGTIGAYLGALIITPLIALTFLGAGFISPMKLLYTWRTYNRSTCPFEDPSKNRTCQEDRSLQGAGHKLEFLPCYLYYYRT